MNDKNEPASTEIEGSRPVKDEEIQEFRRIMEEQVIPKIAETVEKRRLASARSRRKQLKC